MARFYNTAQRNYVDNFIFQPNWDLAAAAVNKREADIQGNLDTLELMRNLPIDYWREADQANVDAIKNEYETRVDDIAKQMQKDVLNSNNKFLVGKLRRDIEKEYDSGRINKIQQNANAYRQYQQSLQALKDPGARQMYSRMASDYLRNNTNGSSDNIFTPEEMYDTRDVWKEFISSDGFKALKADSKASEITNVNGQWMVKEGNSVKALTQSKIGQAFDTFLQSSGLQGYGASRQKYGGEQWLDERGQIRTDAGSYLGNIISTGIPSLAYQETAQSRELKENPYAMASFSSSLAEGREIRAENRAAARKALADRAEARASGLVPELSKKATFAATIAGNAVDLVNSRLDDLGKRYGVKLNTHDVDSLISWANRNKKETFAKELVNLKTSLGEGLRASVEPLYDMGFNKAFVDKYMNNIQTGIQTKGDNIKGVIDYKGLGLPTTGTMSKKVSINELPGKIIGGKKIYRAEIVPKSSYPVFLSDSDLYNQVQSTVRLTFIDGQNDDGTTRFIDRKLDFYQPTTEITGVNSISRDYLKARQ